VTFVQKIYKEINFLLHSTEFLLSYWGSLGLLITFKNTKDEYLLVVCEEKSSFNLKLGGCIKVQPGGWGCIQHPGDQ
jgi:hypothetical protein